MSVALEVEDLSVFAGTTPLLRKLCFAVERGETLTILGESGSGKSLLAQAIMGTLADDLAATGRIAVNGEWTNADSRDRSAHWGKTLALLPQEPWLALDPTMRILNQVAEGYALPRSEAAARAYRDLHAVGLAGAERKYPFMLSGGMAQRAAFAATRAPGAPILIVDEPTKGLDSTLRENVVGILRGAVETGGTLIIITHDVQVARALSGQVVVLNNGEMVESGPLRAVLADPRHEYTRQLIAADPAVWPARSDARIGAPVIRARNLTKRFDDHTLFENMDVSVRGGERIGITGASGAGKTTLGNILIGLTSPDRGTVSRPAATPDLRLQKLYQDPPAAFAQTVSLGRLLRDLVARHGLDWGRAETLMGRLRLPPSLLARRAAQLSGGELQRLAMVRVLLLDPAVILADEPTSRLDPITQRETIDLLVQHAGEQGCALLLVTHDADIARNVAGEQIIAL